ncbi:hypothetical protein BRAS3843_1090027 [Bradyrhizobium sp. STM 3843]|nr:hypothetical protein BRAS3843_1090027 [Bradyrhizobium sp. STM 3843]
MRAAVSLFRIDTIGRNFSGLTVARHINRDSTAILLHPLRLCDSIDAIREDGATSLRRANGFGD